MRTTTKTLTVVVFLAASIGTPVWGNHSPPSAQAINWDLDGILNFTYDKLPAYGREFRLNHHGHFASVNWSRPTEVHAAMNNYTAWAEIHIANLTTSLNMSQPVRQVFQNYYSTALGQNTSSLSCLGSPALANPLLLDTKLTSLYEKLELDDGSLSYLNQTTAGAISLNLKQALVFSIDCLLDSITQVNLGIGQLNRTAYNSTLGNTTKAADIADRLHHNTSAAEETWLWDYLNTTAKFRLSELLNGTALQLDMALQLMDFLTSADCPSSAPAEGLPLDVRGLMRIGSSASDTYTQWYQFTLDCGGSDTYNNNAGGAKYEVTGPSGAKATCPPSLRCAVAIAIDLGLDADYYFPLDLERPSVGSSVGGSGFLFDEGGSDEYKTMRWIGASEAGTAAVFDLAGDDKYLATENPNGFTKYSIGAGGFGGSGLLYDGGGNDLMEHTGADGIGWAGLGGRAAVLNHGGHDIYRLKAGNTGQSGLFASGPGIGMGEYGGWAILLDDEGNDLYVCEATVNYGCQGAGLGGGFGLLSDLAGNDTHWNNATHSEYWKRDHSRGLGGASALGIGILLDNVGDDFYSVSSLAGGHAVCLGIGMLWDKTGVDTYNDSLGQSFGYGKAGSCANAGNWIPGLGLFLDSGGSNDTYTVVSAACGTRANANLWLDGQASTTNNRNGVGKDEGSPLGTPGDCPPENPP